MYSEIKDGQWKANIVWKVGGTLKLLTSNVHRLDILIFKD